MCKHGDMTSEATRRGGKVRIANQPMQHDIRRMNAKPMTSVADASVQNIWDLNGFDASCVGTQNCDSWCQTTRHVSLWNLLLGCCFNADFAPNCKCGVCAILFVCSSVCMHAHACMCVHACMRVCMSVTCWHRACHMRVISQRELITSEQCNNGNLWDRKSELWCHGTAREGSLHNKNMNENLVR